MVWGTWCRVQFTKESGHPKSLEFSQDHPTSPAGAAIMVPDWLGSFGAGMLARKCFRLRQVEGHEGQAKTRKSKIQRFLSEEVEFRRDILRDNCSPTKGRPFF
ncbi:uncharacterized protein PGTG_17532 [Puccinia graminis f. sp. tritici CRL 75-36-700-3]|uniref:Uncharacterized protein n=1 Tax=Puccinia graminis f. sp. tritici (strain CRL 75-36-700-3 / race SCCL) TaxID=418459 RepID=E3L551_PUCGT|nr:uncharacterized protein PGTG_17532 [Puccinia graminis f. sp. tritici CRL 75-36-700-3]EFP91676.1 hypothetical protein PGTG_17532 [Puccinia graminis f. sp. tritici CRL 75-36-700-3]